MGIAEPNESTMASANAPYHCIKHTEFIASSIAALQLQDCAATRNLLYHFFPCLIKSSGILRLAEQRDAQYSNTDKNGMLYIMKSACRSARSVEEEADSPGHCILVLGADNADKSCWQQTQSL